MKFRIQGRSDLSVFIHMNLAFFPRKVQYPHIDPYSFLPWKLSRVERPPLNYRCTLTPLALVITVLARTRKHLPILFTTKSLKFNLQKFHFAWWKKIKSSSFGNLCYSKYVEPISQYFFISYCRSDCSTFWGTWSLISLFNIIYWNNKTEGVRE
jgi:hypothetical protein